MAVMSSDTPARSLSQAAKDYFSGEAWRFVFDFGSHIKKDEKAPPEKDDQLGHSLWKVHLSSSSSLRFSGVKQDITNRAQTKLQIFFTQIESERKEPCPMRIFRTSCLLLFTLAAIAWNRAIAVPYSHVLTTAFISSSPVSRFVTVHVHLRNIGGIATACVVRASGQKRVTGISIDGEADVTFDALASYKGYTVTCEVN